MPPENKTIAILANSIRSQQRCVAGKEVSQSLFWWKPKGWLRLVDPGTKDGEVRIENTYCAGGGHGRVLDVVEVPLIRALGDPMHPEDWLLQSDTPWKPVARLSFPELAGLADAPEYLWHDESGQRTVQAGYVEKMAEPATLYLIKVQEKCVARFWKEASPEAGGLEKVRRRLSIVYGGAEHELDITDPLFARRHNIFETARPEQQEIELNPPLFLCASLTRPWNGKHYKIAASIFESHA